MLSTLWLFLNAALILESSEDTWSRSSPLSDLHNFERFLFGFYELSSCTASNAAVFVNLSIAHSHRSMLIVIKSISRCHSVAGASDCRRNLWWATAVDIVFDCLFFALINDLFLLLLYGVLHRILFVNLIKGIRLRFLFISLVILSIIFIYCIFIVW